MFTNRQVWTNWYGVPAHAWSISFFAYMGAQIGRFLCFDENTNLKKSMEVARVRVSTSSLKAIDKLFKVNIDGTEFTIRVSEELICSCQANEESEDDEDQSDVEGERQWDPDMDDSVDPATATMKDGTGDKSSRGGALVDSETVGVSASRGHVQFSKTAVGSPRNKKRFPTFKEYQNNKSQRPENIQLVESGSQSMSREVNLVRSGGPQDGEHQSIVWPNGETKTAHMRHSEIIQIQEVENNIVENEIGAILSNSLSGPKDYLEARVGGSGNLNYPAHCSNIFSAQGVTQLPKSFWKIDRTLDQFGNLTCASSQSKSFLNSPILGLEYNPQWKEEELQNNIYSRTCTVESLVESRGSPNLPLQLQNTESGREQRKKKEWKKGKSELTNSKKAAETQNWALFTQDMVSIEDIREYNKDMRNRSKKKGIEKEIVVVEDEIRKTWEFGKQLGLAGNDGDIMESLRLLQDQVSVRNERGKGSDKSGYL